MRHTNQELLKQTGATIHPAPDALALNATVGTMSTHSPKDTLFWEADPADYVFQVVRGTICLYTLLADGRRQIARFCHAGDLVGLTAGEVYPYTADALTDAATICIRRKDLDEEMDARSSVRESIFGAMREELRSAQHQLLLLGRKNAMERVASFLIAMSEQAIRQGDNGLTIELPMTRVDIADYLGLTHETVCRALSSLKKSGVVGISDPHRIELLQRDILEDIAEASEECRYAA